MKNTKLNQGLEPENIQDQPSKSKRKILASIGVSSGVLGASALSQHWAKPVVNSVILPAHAQMTEMPGGTMAPGGTTMAPEMTTMAPEMTTMAPDMGPMIIVSPAKLGVVPGGADNTRSVDIKLSMMPSGPVTVTLPTGVAFGGGQTQVFSTTNWNSAVVATVTPVDTTTPEVETKLEITASGGGYDGVKATLTYTSGSFTSAPVTEAKATKDGNTVTITWKEPVTNKPVVEYVVDAGTSTNAKIVTAPATSVQFPDLSDGDYSFTVVARYTKSGASGGDAADSASASTEPASITIP